MYVAASFVEGVFLMFLYDFIRAFRMKVKHGRVWILIEDWLFWLLAAFFVFPMIFTLNHGLIRNFLGLFFDHMFGFLKK